MRERSPAFGALYLTLGCAFVYGIWNTREGFGESTAGTVLIVVVGIAVHVGFGYGIGKWWALALPFALALLAVPAGYPPTDEWEPLPIWFAQLYLAPLEAALMVPGVVARTLRDAHVRSKLG